MFNLIWKEWHEQSWKLAFGCLVLGALAFIGLRSRITADETMMMSVCFIGLALLPILSSTGLLPAERSEGSFESLLALPVAPWKILIAKTVMGFLLCAVPMIVAGSISLLAAGGRELLDISIFNLYFRSTLAALALFVWMLALSARLPNETRGGLLSVGVLIFWILANAGLEQRPIPSIFCAVSPLGFVYGFSDNYYGAPPLLAVLLLQLAIAAVLWGWTSRSITDSVEEKS
jgi:hypothetical protein